MYIPLLLSCAPDIHRSTQEFFLHGLDPSTERHWIVPAVFGSCLPFFVATISWKGRSILWRIPGSKLATRPPCVNDGPVLGFPSRRTKGSHTVSLPWRYICHDKTKQFESGLVQHVLRSPKKMDSSKIVISPENCL